MKWISETETDKGIAHVYPQAGKAHDTAHDDACWCKATPKPVEGGVIWVHHTHKAA